MNVTPTPRSSSLLENLPAPSERRVALHITKIAERAIRDGHPWLFEAAIQKQSFPGKVGDLAVIFDHKDRFLAIGLFDPTSFIRVRVLQRGKPAKINKDWFQDRIKTAARLRHSLQLNNTTGYRLVHGENDGLPGMVIDRYDQNYVIKLYTSALIPHLKDIIDALTHVIDFEGIVLRLSRIVAAQVSLLFGLHDGLVLTNSRLKNPVRFLENSLIFEADIIQGQKTGFFFDQRENRMRVEALANGKSVLNVFAYTGGFSLYAARGGAREITSVDSSQPALETAVRNFALNSDIRTVARIKHEIRKEDAFVFLNQLREANQKYGMVVIDPPSFAKQQNEVPRAISAYRQLVRSGLAILSPNGTFVISSCSSRISENDFFQLVYDESTRTDRSLREIARSSHPLDHPIGFKEGAYLKCLFAILG